MLRPGEELDRRARRPAPLHGLGPRASSPTRGGFQVYSLAQSRKITEEGASFQSHLDGSRWLLTPERSIQIQETLGADIIMAFDECPPSRADRPYLEESLARTTALAAPLRGGLEPGPERALRHRPGRARPRAPPPAPGRGVRGGPAGLRARRLLGGREPGGDARLGGRGGAAAPRGPAPLPDGRGDAGGSGDRGRRRGGHVRLRAAHPVRAQRPALHHPGAAQHAERGARPGRAAARPGVRLLHLPDALARLPAAPLRRRRAAGAPARHAPQPPPLPGADGRGARGHRARTASAPSPSDVRGRESGRVAGRASERPG